MDERKSSGIGIHARRVLAYIVLIFISILCLFWFYVLFVNATRSHAQIQLGFSALPSGEFMNNWVHLMHSSQPVWNGLFNSVIVAAFSAILTTYFSCMTAYAIHVYNFKLKNVMFTFILMIMMIPTQVTALGFYRLMMDWNLMDPLSIDHTSHSSTGSILLYETVHGFFPSVGDRRSVSNRWCGRV